MSEKEKKESEAVLRAIESGVKPPACRGREECDAYCQTPEHAQECFEFALAAGFIAPEEAEEMKKMMELGVTSGPGGCKGKKECEEFCNNPANQNACVEFSVQAGLMAPEEAEKMRRFSQMEMRDGPGGCQNPDECKAYCDSPEHADECMNFGVERGLMDKNQVEHAKSIMEQVRQGGPGGCQDPRSCQKFCDNPNNQAECARFAEQINQMPPTNGQRPGETDSFPPDFMRDNERPPFEQPPAGANHFNKPIDKQIQPEMRPEEFRNDYNNQPPTGFGPNDFHPPVDDAQLPENVFPYEHNPENFQPDNNYQPYNSYENYPAGDNTYREPADKLEFNPPVDGYQPYQDSYKEPTFTEPPADAPLDSQPIYQEPSYQEPTYQTDNFTSQPPAESPPPAGEQP